MTLASLSNDQGQRTQMEMAKLMTNRTDGSDPEKFDAWLTEVNEKAALYNRSPLELAKLSSTGALFDELSHFSQVHSWTHQVAPRLHQAFSSVPTPTYALSKIVGEFQREDENLHVYITRFRKLLRVLNHDENDNPQPYDMFFCRGLFNREVAKKVRDIPRASMQDVFNAAIKIEQNLLDLEGLRRGAVGDVNEVDYFPRGRPTAEELNLLNDRPRPGSQSQHPQRQ